MLAPVKTLPERIIQFLSEQEQISLQDKSMVYLESCYECFPAEGPDSPYTQRIRRLTQNCHPLQEQNIRFHIFNAEEGNAFALGSGDIGIFTSLMDKLDDDELMFVIGHEFAHIVNKDALWGIRVDKATEVAAYAALFAVSRFPLGKAASAAAKTPLLMQIVKGTGRNFAEKLAAKLARGISRICYSRKQESRADRDAVRFLHTHGYRVDAAARALEKIRSEIPESRMEKLTSDHPDIDDRIAKLNRLAGELVA